MTPDPGIYEGVPFEDYLLWDALSKSGMPHLAESPAQYFRYLLTRDQFKQTDPMLVGSAVDVLLFDGLDAFLSAYFRLPTGVSRNTNTTAFNIQRSKNPDKKPLPSAMWDRVFAITDALQDEPDVAEMLRRCKTQVSWLWREPRTQVLIKGRLDMWDMPRAADLKVTGDVSPKGWRRQIRSLRHDWQAALYCEAMTDLTGVVHDEWSWITVRDQPVHRVQIYDLERIDLIESWIEIVELLETYKVCKDANHWPANSGARQPISVRRKTWPQQQQSK